MKTKELNAQPQSATQTLKDIVIERTFDIPLDIFWKAWTNAEILKRWWGPKNFTCPAFYMDLTIGGKYLAGMKDKKDGKVIWSTGNFVEIEPEQKLVMTDSFSDEKGNPVSAVQYGMPGEWPRYLVISISLKGNEGQTEMTLKQGPMPVETADDCITGWQESFDKLEEEV